MHLTIHSTRSFPYAWNMTTGEEFPFFQPLCSLVYLKAYWLFDLTILSMFNWCILIALDALAKESSLSIISLLFFFNRVRTVWTSHIKVHLGFGVWHWKLLTLQILLGGLQTSFLPLSHGKRKLQTYKCQLSYTHTKLRIVYQDILKLD